MAVGVFREGIIRGRDPFNLDDVEIGDESVRRHVDQESAIGLVGRQPIVEDATHPALVRSICADMSCSERKTTDFMPAGPGAGPLPNSCALRA